MNKFLKKLTSRKFLTCVAGIITGLCLIFGADANTVTTISGAVTSLGSIILYIIVEGKIDNTAVLEGAARNIKDALIAIDSVEEKKETEEVEDK